MDILVGLVLVGATLYASTLSFALRTHTRARLARHLSETERELWFARFDLHEDRLIIVASCMRLTTLMATIVWVYGLFLVSGEPVTWAGMVTPTLVNLGLLAIFSVGIPHALAVHLGDLILARNLQLIWALSYPLLPIAASVHLIDVLVALMIGKKIATDEETAEQINQEILEAVSEGEIHGSVDEGQKEMIESVLDLHTVTVGRIMTPRTQMEAISVTLDGEGVRRNFVNSGHSRIPVFDEDLDHIVGVVYAKDLLRLKPGEAFDVRKMMRQALVVPETKSLHDLLSEFREKRVQIAIVLDEYGGTAGLATIEDILEELVGEIEDEYDFDEPQRLHRVAADTIEVDARVSVAEINEALDVTLPDGDDYDTVGGFVFSHMGKIPAKGEAFQHGSVQVTVVDADPRKVKRVRIQSLRAEAVVN